MAISYPSLTLTDATEWVDLVTIEAATASVELTIENIGDGDLYVYFGGATEPGADDGSLLFLGGTTIGTSDHVWVRGLTKVYFQQNDPYPV